MRRIVQGLDVGRRRENNEDFVLIDPALRLGIVADGVGGHKGGDRAARLAAETIHQMLKDQSWVIERIRSGDRGVDPEDLAKVARYALNRASQIIHREAQESLDLRGMSTTCTLLVDLGTRGLVAHVGDSRAYIVRSGQVLRVTEDHVVAVAGGQKAGGKPVKQRVLSRAIGHASECPVDVMWVELRPSDIVLLCSDGLSDQLASDEEVGEVLETFGPDASPEVFIDLANVRGGPDNIGLVVFGAEEKTGDLPPEHAPWAETKAQLQVLRNLQPFASLSYFELELLRPHVRVDVYPAGAKVNVEVPSVSVVAQGKVELDIRGVRSTVGPGGLLGETSLTSNKPWPYTLTVAEQTVLLVIPTTALLGFVADRPFASSRLLWAFLSTASDRFISIADPNSAELSPAPTRPAAPPERAQAPTTASLPPPPAEVVAPAAPAREPPDAPVSVAPPADPEVEAEKVASEPPTPETPSLAQAFTPPPPPKSGLKLPPMPPIGSPIVATQLEAVPPRGKSETKDEAASGPAGREEEASDPWGYDPRDLEAPVPPVTPIEGLAVSTRSLFEEGGQTNTLPPPDEKPAVTESTESDEEERHTLPPPAHRRPTDPPPEDKPT